MFGLVLVALLLISGHSQAQLRYRLTTGEKYGLKQISSQDITQNIQGMTQNIKNTLAGDVSITILSKEADIYSSELVFESLMFKMESAMANMSYDSKDPNQEENMLSKAFDAVVGYGFKMKFDDKGNILEITGFDALVKVIAEKYGSDPASLSLIQESVKSQFSDESMKQNLRSMFIVYPDEKLSSGVQWSNEFETTGAMPMQSKLNYEVKSVNGSLLELIANGTMASAEGFTKEQNGMKQQFNLSGDVVVNARIDLKTGWPQKMVHNQNLEGVVVVESAQLPAPMEIPMSIKSESTFDSY